MANSKNLKQGFYKITVNEKEHFGYRTIIGRLYKPAKVDDVLLFHVGFLYQGGLVSPNVLIIISDDIKKLEKLENRRVSIKMTKNGEKYKLD